MAIDPWLTLPCRRQLGGDHLIQDVVKEDCDMAPQVVDFGFTRIGKNKLVAKDINFRLNAAHVSLLP